MDESCGQVTRFLHASTVETPPILGEVQLHGWSSIAAGLVTLVWLELIRRMNARVRRSFGATDKAGFEARAELVVVWAFRLVAIWCVLVGLVQIV